MACDAMSWTTQPAGHHSRPVGQIGLGRQLGGRSETAMNPGLEARSLSAFQNRFFVSTAHASRAAAAAWSAARNSSRRTLGVATPGGTGKFIPQPGGKEHPRVGIDARAPSQRFRPSARPVQLGASPTGTRLSGRSLARSAQTLATALISGDSSSHAKSSCSSIRRDEAGSIQPHHLRSAPKLRAIEARDAAASCRDRQAPARSKAQAISALVPPDARPRRNRSLQVLQVPRARVGRPSPAFPEPRCACDRPDSLAAFFLFMAIPGQVFRPDLLKARLLKRVRSVI